MYAVVVVVWRALHRDSGTRIQISPTIIADGALLLEPIYGYIYAFVYAVCACASWSRERAPPRTPRRTSARARARAQKTHTHTNNARHCTYARTRSLARSSFVCGENNLNKWMLFRKIYNAYTFFFCLGRNRRDVWYVCVCVIMILVGRMCFNIFMPRIYRTLINAYTWRSTH